MNSYYEKFPDGKVVCIDEEIPFEIPEGWEWIRFGHITFNRDSERIPLSVSERNGLQKIYDYYGASGVIDKVDKYLFEGDLLLIGEDGANLINRSTPIAYIASGKYWVNNHAHVIDCRNLIEIQYLELFINAISLVPYVTGTAQPKMNQEKMNSILIAVAPLAEQLRIIEKVKSILPLIEKYHRANTKLDLLNHMVPELLRKSILNEAIQGRLVPQNPDEEPSEKLLERINAEKQRLVKEGKLKAKETICSVIFKGDDNKYYEQIGSNVQDISEEIPFEIPDSWMWCRFGNIVKMHIGKTPPRGESKYWADGTYPWVAISDMNNSGHIKNTKEKISLEAATSLMGNNISHIGDLLMSFKLTVGKTAILDIDAFHNEAIITIAQYYDDNNIVRDYLFNILPIISNLGDSKDAIKGKTLNSQSLFNLLIPLPPICEQQRIVQKIDEIQTLIQ